MAFPCSCSAPGTCLPLQAMPGARARKEGSFIKGTLFTSCTQFSLQCFSSSVFLKPAFIVEQGWTDEVTVLFLRILRGVLVTSWSLFSLLFKYSLLSVLRRNTLNLSLINFYCYSYGGVNRSQWLAHSNVLILPESKFCESDFEDETTPDCLYRSTDPCGTSL